MDLRGVGELVGWIRRLLGESRVPVVKSAAGSRVRVVSAAGSRGLETGLPVALGKTCRSLPVSEPALAPEIPDR
jgi:hypothetical protein